MKEITEAFFSTCNFCGKERFCKVILLKDGTSAILCEKCKGENK